MPSSIIGNNHISCTIDSQGAQMVSLRSEASGKEYIWQGNPDVWKWHAPVLFPFCGNFPEGFMYNGKKYHLPQHGFLRNVEHTRISDGVYVPHITNKELDFASTIWHASLKFMPHIILFFLIT